MLNTVTMNIDLLLDSYDYHLPDELIAMRPTAKRENCRLLIYKKSTGQIIHSSFHEIGNYFPKNTHLVLNSSRVIPCRLLGSKKSGGKAEVFILSNRTVLIKSSGKKHIGDCYKFDQGFEANIVSANDGTFGVKFFKDGQETTADTVMNRIGTMPIPPYIRDGVSDEQDKLDYQTVYAKEEGSVAAPTAGLHFSKELLDQLSCAGFDHSYLTLHVGHGTFAPVKSDNILEHKMHHESYFMGQETVQKLELARKAKRPIIAVGTTALRALESSVDIKINPNELYSTNIFLYPGKQVKSVNGLLTNFHLPKSTLLMLVSSLIGRNKVLEIYRIATKQGYRFFSYGDAMLILE